ncbi:conserved Plasmodium protein, unknown function [Plasmodium relictum]|uniref:Uncharacterized protein n=1 Tax=Plasmodium relictum TaxID=85471 RepID=A0A1J1H1A2_PLARL|nr:conserved Plasmodium protein, unknown function [Plasmodium relictum]CRG98698.1 conserved Plasmodium protein, unknown function [Plasmodium relictum]
MKKKSIKKLRYLDSKGKLYSNGIKTEPKSKYDQIDFRNNYSLIENYSELKNLLKQAEEQYDFLKKELNLLQQKKDLLQWHICNNIKKLSMKRSEKQFKEETRIKLETKLKSLKDKTRIYKFEHDTLEEEVSKMEEELEKKMYVKNDVENKFNEWLNKKDDYLKDLTQERIQALNERKRRQNQLKKLLLVMKQENNKNYNINYLKKYESNLMNEISSYKNYNDFETKMVMDLIKMNS